MSGSSAAVDAYGILDPLEGLLAAAKFRKMTGGAIERVTKIWAEDIGPFRLWAADPHKPGLERARL
jgi:hypothetical protein